MTFSKRINPVVLETTDREIISQRLFEDDKSLNNRLDDK